MGIRFAKSIKIGNYLRINFNKSGISATVGKKGASVNIGGKGAYLNLSPSAIGISGTGLSYRQKIIGGLGSSKKKSTAKSSSKKKTYISASESKTSSLKKNETVEEVKENVLAQQTDPETKETVDVVKQYKTDQEVITNIHKYAPVVMSKKEYADYVEDQESAAMKEICRYAMEGDEDTIENMVSSFMNNLKLAYDVRVNYELEDNILYVDLDLPEIEDLQREYPVYNGAGKLVYRRKTAAELKEEYARLVMSLGVFLTAGYFNISSYIDEVVMSAFTTVRNKSGDLVDQYLYSVKYTREAYEGLDLSTIDDLNEFLLHFENRINMSSAYSFKAIKPYEMESVIKANELVEDALGALKQLGYKSAELNGIRERLSECRYETSGEYLKEGLRLLKEEK